MTILFVNNATTLVASPIAAGTTSVTVAPGSGAAFPNPGVGEYFVATFIDAATGIINEIVHVTGRSTDTMTIVRAQEGTTALAWAAGDRFESLWTAGQAAAMNQTGVTPGTLISTQVVLAAGTTTPVYPSGTNLIDIELVGAGGSGGGAAATSLGEGSAGSGGGGGASIRGLIAIGAATGQALVIGAAGAPGTAGGNGLPGGSSTFGGTLMVAPGGAGGSAGAAQASPAVTGTSGVSATPSLASPPVALVFAGLGQESGLGIVMSGSNLASGEGGGSIYGAGAGQTSGSPGTAALTAGAGGSGASNLASTAATAGGAGANGYAIIRSYQ